MPFALTRDQIVMSREKRNFCPFLNFITNENRTFRNSSKISIGF